MGEILSVYGSTNQHIIIHTVGCIGSVVHLLLDGEEAGTATHVPVSCANGLSEFTVNTGAGRHWLRADRNHHRSPLHIEAVSAALAASF
jgi:hypothetical protein